MATTSADSGVAEKSKENITLSVLLPAYIHYIF